MATFGGLREESLQKLARSSCTRAWNIGQIQQEHRHGKVHLSFPIDASDKYKVAGAVIPNVGIDREISISVSRNEVGLSQRRHSDRGCMGEIAYR